MKFSHQVVFYRTKLSALQQRALLRHLLNGAATEYGPGDCMIIWLAQHLEGVGFLSYEQRGLLLEEIAADLQLFGRRISVDWSFDARARSGCAVPNYQLVFAEGCYATWTDKSGFLNLTDGMWMDKTPRPILESLGYNLTELFCRNVERCGATQQILEGDKDASITEEPDTA